MFLIKAKSEPSEIILLGKKTKQIRTMMNKVNRREGKGGHQKV